MLLISGFMILGLLLPEYIGLAFNASLPWLHHILCSISLGLISGWFVYGL